MRVTSCSAANVVTAIYIENHLAETATTSGADTEIQIIHHFYGDVEITHSFDDV